MHDYWKEYDKLMQQMIPIEDYGAAVEKEHEGKYEPKANFYLKDIEEWLALARKNGSHPSVRYDRGFPEVQVEVPKSSVTVYDEIKPAPLIHKHLVTYKRRYHLNARETIRRIMNSKDIHVDTVDGDVVASVRSSGETIFSYRSGAAFSLDELFYILANYAHGVELQCEAEINIPESALAEEFLTRCKKYFAEPAQKKTLTPQPVHEDDESLGD